MLSPEELKKFWTQFHKDHPGVPLREAARELEVSEAELLSTFLDDGATELQSDWPTWLALLPQLGRVLFETRTENAILEAHGLIDFKCAAWQTIFAVEEETHEGTLQSLQIFGHSGEALVKIYIPDDQETLLGQWTKRLRLPQQTPLSGFTTKTFSEKPDRQFDSREIRKQFTELHSLVAFDQWIEKSHITKTQAYRLLGKDRAEAVNPRTVKSILEKIAEEEMPLLTFLSNPGSIQQVSGCLQEVSLRGPWLIATGKDFKLQLRYPRLGSAWVVKKHIQDSPIITLEYFDKTGEDMLGFSLAINGQDKLQQWQKLCSEISRVD